MLIRSHDAPFDDDEWRTFLREHDFGQLVAAGAGRVTPAITPVHFVYDGGATILLHLARANPVLAALAENPVAVMAVIGAYTYIPTDWNANPGEAVEYGVPTSYYAAVQATGVCEIIDDPEALAEILRTQLAHFQPAGGPCAGHSGRHALWPPTSRHSRRPPEHYRRAGQVQVRRQQDHSPPAQHRRPSSGARLPAGSRGAPPANPPPRTQSFVVSELRWRSG